MHFLLPPLVEDKVEETTVAAQMAILVVLEGEEQPLEEVQLLGKEIVVELELGRQLRGVEVEELEELVQMLQIHLYQELVVSDYLQA